jgi:lipoprotein-releasing system permease protein
MSFESFVARRYLKKRNMSRFLSFMTIVSIGSVAVGVAALIITFTILDGFERELRTNITGLSAHIRIGVFRNQTVAFEPQDLTIIKQVPGVENAAPFFQKEAIVISRDHIDGVFVKGIGNDTSVYLLRAKIIEGTHRTDSIKGKPGIVVGKRFADKLGLKLHDKLVLLGVNDIQQLSNAPKVQFVISGIYETGMAEYYDDLYVFAALPVVQKLFLSRDGVNGYDVLCSDIEDTEEIVDVLQSRLGYPFDPRSVFSIYRNLFVWIDLQKELIPIVVGSLIVISVFNILSTLLLFVIEKTQEIGVLKALGASKKSIMSIFLYQGLIIGGVGALTGSALAFIFCAAQAQFQFFSLPNDVYYMTTVPIYMKPTVFLATSGLGIILTLLSSVIPAWLGSRLHPISSIRFY